MASGLISMEYGLRGPNLCIVTACATSNNAIGESWRMIKFGDADIFLAGGSEASVVAIGLAGFSAMRALSTRNDEPERASRPFDRDRDGFVMSEGAGVVVVEELEHAKARGAKIYCELSGYGMSADAYHMTAPPPDGKGAARAMQLALEHACISPDQVDYINAHATSTDIGDIIETRAIKKVFGEHSRKIPVSGTKAFTSHPLGATGAIEATICTLALEHQYVPPTLHRDHPDEACDLDVVPHHGRAAKLNYVMSNSFGFGGINACVVLGRID